jgi:hypothetical protein
MKRIHVSCLLAAAAMIAKANASFFDDFNTPGTFLNDYNIYQNTTPPTLSTTGSPYTQSATTGVGGTGGIDVITGGTAGITPDSTAINKGNVFDFSTSGSSLTISAMMKVIPPLETNNRELHLGFSTDATSGMNGNTGLSFMSLRFNPTAVGSTTFTPQWQTKTAAGAVVNTSVTPNITFVANDWYLMSLTFVNNGGGAIAGSGFVQDFGTDGLTVGAVTSITGASLTSADIAADPSVYAAFRGFQRDGLATLDNLSAVPEPSSIALLGFAGAGLFLVRRRKS